MKGLTVQELKRLLEEGKDIQLVDVREPDEHADFNIGGILIPLENIVHEAGAIDPHKPVVLYCRKGIRSQFAVQKLEDRFSFTNLYNLIGGTEAWKQVFGS